MVQFKNVTKTFANGFTAVKDINFIINEGEFVFLIGPSGSGKTTIIELLIRDQKPSEGQIYINDHDITNISRNQVYKLRRKIGVIFQDFKLIQDQTAYENVAFAMEAAGRSNKEIKETVPYVLDIVGLGNKMTHFPKQLSGGEQQRVAIARAISNNPKVLIADEPTGNLDPASAWDIVQILSKINNWGTTVVMSTHGTDIVNTLNKRVIQMEDGVLKRDDSEGQYEFQDKVSPEVVEDVLEDTKKAKVKKGPLQVNLGSDLAPESKLDELSTEESKDQEDQEETISEDEAEEIVEKKGLFGRIFQTRDISKIEKKSEKVGKDSDFEKSVLGETEQEEQSIQEESDSEEKVEETPRKKLHISLGALGMGADDKEDVQEPEEATINDLIEAHKSDEIEFINMPKSIIDKLHKSKITKVGDLSESKINKMIASKKISKQDSEIIKDVLQNI